jgi:hypothetical protein
VRKRRADSIDAAGPSSKMLCRAIVARRQSAAVEGSGGRCGENLLLLMAVVMAGVRMPLDATDVSAVWDTRDSLERACTARPTHW